MPYTHKLNVEVNGQILVFEPDKEKIIELSFHKLDTCRKFGNIELLEKGTYEVPLANYNDKAISISHEALQHILQGVSLRSVRKRKRYQQAAESCG